MVRDNLVFALSYPDLSSSGGEWCLIFDHFAMASYRYRHNELDLPGITSPLMYEHIAARKSVPQLYEQKLIVGVCFSLAPTHLIQTSISGRRSTLTRSHFERPKHLQGIP